MKKIIFISEYSKENLFLAESLCDGEGSKAFLWETEELKKSKLSYFDVVGSISDDIANNIFIISGGVQREDFILNISKILNSVDADIVITRGTTSSIWPIALVRKQFNLTNIPFMAILDRINKVEEFDKNILENFDSIYGLGPSCLIEDFKEKTCLFSNKIEYSKYIGADNFEGKDILVLYNKKNSGLLRKHPRLKRLKASFVDPKECPPEDLNIILNISGIVIDESGYSFSQLILDKMGIQSFKLDKFFEGNIENFIEQTKDILIRNYRKKVFFHFLRKEMEVCLEKLNYSPKIKGSTIGF